MWNWLTQLWGLTGQGWSPKSTHLGRDGQKWAGRSWAPFEAWSPQEEHGNGRACRPTWCVWSSGKSYSFFLSFFIFPIPSLKGFHWIRWASFPHLQDNLPFDKHQINWLKVLIMCVKPFISTEAIVGLSNLEKVCVCATEWLLPLACLSALLFIYLSQKHNLH